MPSAVPTAPSVEATATLPVTATSPATPRPARREASSGLDALARAAVRATGSTAAMVTLVSTVGPAQHVVVGTHGLSEPWGLPQQSPHGPPAPSFCAQVVQGDRPLVVDDVRALTGSGGTAPIADLGVAAYAAVPLHAPDGTAVGAFCLIHRTPRPWTADDLGLLTDLATAATAEVARTTLEHEHQRRVRELDELTSEITAVVSHELRTPLTVITGYAQLLATSGTLSTADRVSLRAIVRRTAEMSQIVDDLFELAEDDAGLRIEHRGLLDLDALVRRAAAEHAPAFDRAEVRLSLDLAAGPAVRCDPRRIGQVVDNLLGNAVKYTGNGGHVEVRTRRDPDGVGLCVADTGIGVDPGELDLIFDRFFRATTARDRAIRGAGLGLAVTREILRAHGGTIRATGNEHGGTTFTAHLPSGTTRRIDPEGVAGPE